MALLAQAANEQPSELRLVLHDQDRARSHSSLAEDERGVRDAAHWPLIGACSTVHGTRTGGTRGVRRAQATRCAVPGGATGNGRLTSLVGIVLLVLLAVEGATITSIRPAALRSHLRRDAAARSGGPEAREHRLPLRRATTPVEPTTSGRGRLLPLMRVLVAPVLVLSTLTLFGSGVALLAVPQRGAVLGLHKASFIVWFGAMAIHVLAYTVRAGRRVRGRPGRRAG